MARTTATHCASEVGGGIRLAAARTSPSVAGGASPDDPFGVYTVALTIRNRAVPAVRAQACQRPAVSGRKRRVAVGGGLARSPFSLPGGEATGMNMVGGRAGA